jgi:hypothetical protein
MQFKISILEKNKDIENKILQTLLPSVNKVLVSYYKSIIPTIKTVITTTIKNSPEYTSLTSGVLKYELGIPDADTRINNLLNIWLSNINAEFKPVVIKNSQIVGSLKISLIKADLSDVLGSDAAFLTDNNTGSMVDWLNWLTLAGDRTIIKDYNFIVGSNPRSRTGGGIMRYAPGSGKWKVPSGFSGTLNNNWITRAIDSSANEIDKILSNTLKAIV